MGQGQSGQAGFPGQGPPGEKKDQVMRVKDLSNNNIRHAVATMSMPMKFLIHDKSCTCNAVRRESIRLMHVCCRARRRRNGSLHRLHQELERSREEPDR